MDGDCGIFKRLNYTFLTLAGDSLFTMVDREVGFTDPRNETIFWHEFKVPSNNKSFKLAKDATFVNDKQVAKFVFGIQPGFIKDGAIDTFALSKFIDKNDFTPTLIADSSANFEFERIQKSALDGTIINRNLSQPIVLKPISYTKYAIIGFSGTSAQEIVQDNVLLGVIVIKEVTTMQGGKEFKYYFLKKLSNSFEFNGKQHVFGLVAYVDGMSFLKNIYVKESTSYTPPANSTNVLLDYTKHLVSVGCYK
jgi:hypothetical protein